MTAWNRTNGDLKDTVSVTLSGVEDLTTVTAVEAHVWANGVAPVTLTAAVASASLRTVTVQLGGVGGWLPTAVARSYLFETQVTFADGSVITWPSKGADQLTVRAQGA